jgi:energy-coupling factor transporter transmembrane protein EcfT
MKNDTLYATGVSIVFLSVVARGWFCSMMLELLLSLTRPGATVLLLGLIAYVYSQGLVLTALALTLLTVYLLNDLWTNWVRSDARRLHLEVGRDQARFNPGTSVDLQWATKSVSHDSPNMLHKDVDASPLLLYPPSQSTLESMSG